MVEAIISLGSNNENRREILTAAIDYIDAEIVSATEVYCDNHGYANIVAKLRTPKSYSDLNRCFKDVERKFGRTHGDQIVALDIDIVVYDGEIVRPSDYEQPYFRKGLALLSNH